MYNLDLHTHPDRQNLTLRSSAGYRQITTSLVHSVTPLNLFEFSLTNEPFPHTPYTVLMLISLAHPPYPVTERDAQQTVREALNVQDLQPLTVIAVSPAGIPIPAGYEQLQRAPMEGQTAQLLTLRMTDVPAYLFTLHGALRRALRAASPHAPLNPQLISRALQLAGRQAQRTAGAP